MSKTKKSQSWLVTLPVAGAAVAYVWYVFLPGQKTLSSLQNELLTKRTFAINQAKYESDTRAVNLEIESARKFIDHSNRSLAGPNDLSRLYGEIAAIAKQAGVETTRFSPDPARPYARLVKCPVNLGCEGTFAQVASLIEGLERLPQRVWLEHLSIEAIEDKEGLLRCELILEVFANNLGFSS